MSSLPFDCREGAVKVMICFQIKSHSKRSNGWIDDLRFYVFFISISVISGQRMNDNEKLCALEE